MYNRSSRNENAINEEVEDTLLKQPSKQLGHNNPIYSVTQTQNISNQTIGETNHINTQRTDKISLMGFLEKQPRAFYGNANKTIGTQ